MRTIKEIVEEWDAALFVVVPCAEIEALITELEARERELVNKVLEPAPACEGVLKC